MLRNTSFEYLDLATPMGRGRGLIFQVEKTTLGNTATLPQITMQESVIKDYV